MKARKNISFVVFCSILTVGLVWVFGTFKAYFESGSENAHIAESSAMQVRIKQDEVVRLQNQIKDLQFQTAIALGRDSQNNQIKDQLLQTTRMPASDQSIDLSEVAYQKAKGYFGAKDWRHAIAEFSDFVRDYPLSPRVTEAYFLLGESYFKANKFREMLDVVEIMVSQFPESDLTGFLLLRQAQLSVSQHQLEEAREVCSLIKNEYKNQALLSQVEILEHSFEL